MGAVCYHCANDYGGPVLVVRAMTALVTHGPLAGWEIAQRVRHVEGEVLARALSTLSRLGVIEERPRGCGRAWFLLRREE